MISLVPNNPRSPNMFLWAVPVADDRLQSRAIMRD
jgi:hypothetical protein